MKTEQSTAAKSLRAVGLAISLVSLVTFSTVAYSGYADYNAILRVFGSQSTGSAITAKTVVSGSDATLYLNVTVPNDGLYTLSVGISCPGISMGANATCKGDQITVAPGETGLLQFSMTVHNATQAGSGLDTIKMNGRVDVALKPFATLSVVFDVGSLFKSGGA